MELLFAVVVFGISALFFMVWKECQELRKDNAELKRELARAVAEREPWLEEGCVVYPKAA